MILGGVYPDVRWATYKSIPKIITRCIYVRLCGLHSTISLDMDFDIDGGRTFQVLGVRNSAFWKPQSSMVASVLMIHPYH